MHVNKAVSVKPMSEVHFYIMITCLYLPFFPLEIYAIFGDEKMLQAIMITYVLIVITAYVLYRFFYNVRYTVNSEYLVKTKDKKIVFKIPVEKILGIYIKRASKLGYFPFVLDWIISGSSISKYKKTHGTNFSIVFKECDVLKKEDHDVPCLSLKPEELKDCFEHNEILSFRKCMKICKVMGIEPQIITKKKRKQERS